MQFSPVLFLLSRKLLRCLACPFSFSGLPFLWWSSTLCSFSCLPRTFLQPTTVWKFFLRPNQNLPAHNWNLLFCVLHLRSIENKPWIRKWTTWIPCHDSLMVTYLSVLLWPMYYWVYCQDLAGTERWWGTLLEMFPAGFWARIVAWQLSSENLLRISRVLLHRLPDVARCETLFIMFIIPPGL